MTSANTCRLHTSESDAYVEFSSDQTCTYILNSIRASIRCLGVSVSRMNLSIS